MLMPRAPGVYTRELDSGVRTIVGASTSVALFVGPTASGIDGRPQRIASYSDFERLYGGLSATSNLSYSVLHFFSNGGSEAFVARVPPNGSVAAGMALRRANANQGSIRLTSLSRGAGGGEIHVEVDSFGTGADVAANPLLFNLTLTHRLTRVTERFGSISTSPAAAREAGAVIADPATGSRLVALAVLGANAAAPQPTGTILRLPDLAGAGNFATPVRLSLTVAVRDAAGAVQNGLGFTLNNITIFAAGTPRPTSKLELVTRTLTAINAAIRADDNARTRMNGLEIEGQLFEAGAYLRLRVAMPGPGMLDRRIADATITLAAPNPAPVAPELGWLAAFNDAGFPIIANPSRYRLGAAYAAAQAFDPVVGLDGDPSGQPSADAMRDAVLALDIPDPFFNILCLPDLARPAANDPLAPFFANAMAIYGEAARICARKHAFLLVDPPPSAASVGAALAWKQSGFPFQSSHAAAWFPNIRVDDPLVAGSIRSHPPSGALAGVMARTDAEAGVWQAPAGTDAVITGAYGPALVLSDDDHGQLNPLGLNCIRQFPVFGTVAFGSRTVDGADAMASQWKYVPVRRTSSFILRSLQEGLRWAVHKPNGEELWSQLRINVTAFLHGLFRQGAFKGVSARDAYFVKCDASTTPQADIDLGIVNIVIGFAPLKPAEFVIISLRQIVQPAA